MYQFDQKDYCHEPMFTIFTKHDKDKDGFLSLRQINTTGRVYRLWKRLKFGLD